MKKPFALMLTTFTTAAVAGANTTWGVPTQVDVVRGEGMMIYGSFGNPGGCSVADKFFVPINTTQYSQIYAAVLTAMASGKEISAYVASCTPLGWYAVLSTTYNQVTGSEAVYMRNP